MKGVAKPLGAKSGYLRGVIHIVAKGVERNDDDAAHRVALKLRIGPAGQLAIVAAAAFTRKSNRFEKEVIERGGEPSALGGLLQLFIDLDGGVLLGRLLCKSTMQGAKHHNYTQNHRFACHAQRTEFMPAIDLTQTLTHNSKLFRSRRIHSWCSLRCSRLTVATCLSARVWTQHRTGHTQYGRGGQWHRWHGGL